MNSGLFAVIKVKVHQQEELLTLDGFDSWLRYRVNISNVYKVSFVLHKQYLKLTNLKIELHSSLCQYDG